jgi:hypothetical protein
VRLASSIHHCVKAVCLYILLAEQPNMIVDLAQHRIQGPQDSFYIPDFVTQTEEEYLIRKVC